ncbi:MAG: zinc ribbon domain-containing protein [Ruminococcaceae bacterium]|nr:zinc ribbon domain-containing protein [Oscillospiraceae bacterium]
MFCPNCGSEIKDGARFCVSCGKPVENNSGAVANEQPNQYYQSNQYQQAPYNQYQYTQPVQPVQPALGMKWFKFVIYFSLWAGAILNIGYAIMAFTGAHYETEYEGAAELVYAMFEELKTIDLLYGLAMIALAVYMIVARFRLAGYYKNGPAMFISTYAIALLISVVYYVAVLTVVPEVADADNVVSNLVGNAIGNGLMILLNSIYFKKRKHMFIN